MNAGKVHTCARNVSEKVIKYTGKLFDKISEKF